MIRSYCVREGTYWCPAASTVLCKTAIRKFVVLLLLYVYWRNSGLLHPTVGETKSRLTANWTVTRALTGKCQPCVHSFQTYAYCAVVWPLVLSNSRFGLSSERCDYSHWADSHAILTPCHIENFMPFFPTLKAHWIFFFKTNCVSAWMQHFTAFLLLLRHGECRLQLVCCPRYNEFNSQHRTTWHSTNFIPLFPPRYTF